MTQSAAVTQTLERGLLLLRAFQGERKPLTNVELVRRTGLSRSSVSRLTITLVNLGYLRRVSGGSELELAVGGLGIGYAYAKANPVTQHVHPCMQELADRLDAIVALAVPDGLDMLYIACRNSMQITTLQLNIGSLLPMGSTAIGRAWLWALPPQERQRYAKAIMDAAGPDAAITRQCMEQAFEELEASGVCTVASGYRRNTYGVALPLRVGRSQTLMALNCGMVGQAPDLGTIRDRIAPALKQTAQEIAELLHDLDAEP